MKKADRPQFRQNKIEQVKTFVEACFEHSITNMVIIYGVYTHFWIWVKKQSLSVQMSEHFENSTNILIMIILIKYHHLNFSHPNFSNFWLWPRIIKQDSVSQTIKIVLKSMPDVTQCYPTLRKINFSGKLVWWHSWSGLAPLIAAYTYNYYDLLFALLSTKIWLKNLVVGGKKYIANGTSRWVVKKQTKFLRGVSI